MGLGRGGFQAHGGWPPQAAQPGEARWVRALRHTSLAEVVMGVGELWSIKLENEVEEIGRAHV